MSEASDSGVEDRLARHGKVSYLEIPALDLEQSAAFYERLFGWQVERRDAEHVNFSDVNDGLIGHWILGRPISSEPGIIPYIYVDGVDRVVAAATAAGGAVVKAPYAEGNLTIATLRDPAGNVIGVWQAPSA